MARAIIALTPRVDNVDDVMAEHVNTLQTNQEKIWNTFAFVGATELTIAAGVVTATSNYHTIDTAGDIASDDLDTITISGNIGEGSLLFIRPDHDGRSIVIKHDTGNISCVGQADITLNDIEDFAILIYDETLTKWLAMSTADGIVNVYASIAETSAATEAAKAITPDGLAGSDYGKRSAILQPIADVTAHTVADGVMYWPTPEWLAGWNLVDVRVHIITAGTTLVFTVDVYNLTQATSMLTDLCEVDTLETSSDDATNPVVINAAEDDITLGDVLRIDFTTIHTTPGEGCIVELVFSMP